MPIQTRERVGRFTLASVILLLAGCGEDRAPVERWEAVVANEEGLRLVVSSVVEDGARLNDGVATIAPNQVCLFTGYVQWDRQDEKYVLLELQRRLDDSTQSQIATGYILVDENSPNDRVDFAVDVSIGQISAIDCDVVLMAIHPVDGTRTKIAASKVRISS